jgi:hypothetical protein
MPFFLIQSVGSRGLLTQTSLRLAADALSCALPRVPHFGQGGRGGKSLFRGGGFQEAVDEQWMNMGLLPNPSPFKITL